MKAAITKSLQALAHIFHETNREETSLQLVAKGPQATVITCTSKLRLSKPFKYKFIPVNLYHGPSRIVTKFSEVLAVHHPSLSSLCSCVFFF